MGFFTTLLIIFAIVLVVFWLGLFGFIGVNIFLFMWNLITGIIAFIYNALGAFAKIVPLYVWGIIFFSAGLLFLLPDPTDAIFGIGTIVQAGLTLLSGILGGVALLQGGNN